MRIPQRLKECEAYAVAIRDRIDALKARAAAYERLPDNLVDALQRLHQRATEAVEAAASPVKVGVVGEFNAGKTLLLGSLIGFADGLPVQPYPTTGNVTWLRFKSVEELKPTRLTHYRVEYLSLRGVEECLEAMLVEAKARGMAANLDSSLMQELHGFRAADADVWTSLQDWSKRAWQQSRSVLLRLLIREVIVFVRAYLSCGLHLCRQPIAYKLSPQIAADGLALPPTQGDLQHMGFDELPPPAPPLTEAPPELSPTLLHLSFPLIKRVEVQVEISRQIWDWSSQSGSTEFVLLDFPGLGAADSGVRDTYLCRRELTDVQTVLILLNSMNPGGVEGATFFNLLQSDRPGVNLRDQVLVGLGRFDQLPLGTEGETKLEELTADIEEVSGAIAEPALDILDVLEARPKVTLTETELFERLRVLKTALDGATNLTPDADKILLLSPMLALARLHERHGTIKIGSDRFLENLTGDSALALKVAKLWGKVADKLRQTDPQSKLIPWLSEFVADGGASAFREKIGKHVAEFGLQQLFDAVRRKVDSLSREQAKFATLLPPEGEKAAEQAKPQPIANELVPKFRRILGELTRKYTNLIFKLTNNPPELEVERDGSLISVNQVVESECVFQVCEWNEWNALFENSHNNRLTEHSADWTQDVFKTNTVASASVSQNTLGDWLGNVFGAATVPPPTRSDDFEKPFENTVKQLETFSVKVVTEAIHARMERIASELVNERDDLSFAINNPSVGPKVQSAFGQVGAVLYAVLTKSLRPEELTQPILTRGQLTPDTYKSLEVKRLFPLPKRTFAWASSIANLPANLRPEEKHAHLIKAPILRDAFVESMQKAMTQIVSEATKKANQASLELFRSIHEKLRQIVNNDRLLGLIAEESAPREEANERLEAKTETPTALRELAAIHSPL